MTKFIIFILAIIGCFTLLKKFFPTLFYYLFRLPRSNASSRSTSSQSNRRSNDPVSTAKPADVIDVQTPSSKKEASK